MEVKPQKKSGLKELIISFVGVYACYISGGYLVEKINKEDYSGKGEMINHTVAIVILQSIFSYIFGVILCILNPTQAHGMTIPTQLKCGIYTFISLVAGLQGNINLNFVTNNLVQNCKSLAILFITAVSGKYKYNRNEIITVFLMTTGIFVYFSDIEQKNTKQVTWLSYLTCAVSLLSSGLLGASQKVATDKESSTSYDLLKYTNLWAGICSILYAFFTGEMWTYLEFYPKYPRALSEVFVLVMTGVVGQFFIYYTIEKFSPLFFSIVSTSRKFMNIYISILVFGHKISMIQYGGMFLITFGVVYEIWSKSAGTKKTQDKKE